MVFESVGAHISLGAWVERNTGVDDNYFSIGANSKIKGLFLEYGMDF